MYLSEDLDSEHTKKIISKKRENEFNSHTQPFIIKPNTQKAPKREMELYEKILREQRLVLRQDYKVYQFNFANIFQAISIVLGVFMIFDLILFLYYSYNLDPNPNWKEIMSWVMFVQSGFLILFSGLTIPRLSLVVKQRKIRRNEDPRIRGLKFAFVHSLTYFVSGICMAVLSFFAYKILHV